ncbi:MAG: type II secretion system protein [bacterium]
MSFIISKNKGFTLVEIILVVVLIGIVAAATLGIVNYIQDFQYKTAEKKAFSTVSQAVEKARTDNLLTAAKNVLPRPTDFDKNFISIMSEFKVTKQCTNNDNDQCWNVNGEKFGLFWGGAYPLQEEYAFIDSSGMAWSQYYSGSFTIFVDTNGFKKPNQWGKDRFAFSIMDKDGIAETTMDVPIKVVPYADNEQNLCKPLTSTVCATARNYYGRSWIYN